MKRFIPTALRPVAVAILGLVAMQPALAGLFCSAPAAPCPMAITDVGPHCGGVSPSDVDGSRPATRVHAVPRTMASVALPATRKVLALAAAEEPVEALPAPQPISTLRDRWEPTAESPPIYLRNCVFRI